MRPAGSFTVPPDHPALPGHFPGRPIVPGVMLLDETAALILAAEPGRALAGFPAVRFTHPVRPGERVEVEYADKCFTCNIGGRAVVSGTVSLI